MNDVYTESRPRLSYRVSGTSGPRLLLIMGYGMRGIVWRAQIDGLEADHQVLTYDHPGLGQSDSAEARPTMRHLGRHPLRILDELGWEDVHLVGVSMGGMIAQELALYAPNRFRSLTLIATHAGGLRTFLPSLKGLRLFVRGNLQDGKGRVKTLQELLYTPEFLAKVDGAEIERRMRDTLGDRAPRATLLGHLHAVARHRAKSRLRSITLPTLIVRPGRDLLVRPSNSDYLHAQIPGSRLLRFDEAGHGVTFQEADALNEALRDHVAR